MVTGLDAAALRFIDGAAPPRPPFEEEFVAFLRKALGATVSANASESRTDTLIEAGILNALSSRTILDVCCGRPLLLHSLIKQLKTDPNRQTEYRYVACDSMAGQEEFKLHIEELTIAASPLGVTVLPVLADAADPKAFASAVHAKFTGRFDLILFSNALHEVWPPAVPALLFTLVTLLEDEGRLVIVDPEPTWLLDEKRWKSIAKLDDLAIDWEASAVWLPSETYAGVLRRFGCTVTRFDADRTQAFWVLQATRPVEFDLCAGETLVREATELLKNALLDQSAAQIARYTACRKDLRTQVMASAEKRAIMYKAVEFLAVCASQARRFEVAREFR